MIKFPKKYTMELDEQVKAIIRKDIARKGIESYISYEFVRLDCSRVLNNMLIRFLGTIFTLLYNNFSKNAKQFLQARRSHHPFSVCVQ